MIAKILRFRRPAVSDRGSIAVEFAIVAPLLILFVIGAIDYGTMMHGQSTLEAATRAGAEYAWANPTNTAGIQGAVTNYASFSPAVASKDVTVTTFCTCSDNTPVTCPQGTTDPCPAAKAQTDTRVLSYVAVQATQSFEPVLSWGGFWPSSLNAGTVTRVQ